MDECVCFQSSSGTRLHELVWLVSDVVSATVFTAIRIHHTTAMKCHRLLGRTLGVGRVEVCPLALALVLNGPHKCLAH